MKETCIRVVREKVVLDIGFFRGVVKEFTNTQFDGTESAVKKHFVLERGDSVAALIHLVSSDEIILVEQMRIAANGWILELAAGRIDEDEAPEHAIQREVKEEIDVTSTNFERIGSVYPSPGGCSELVHLFYCPIEGPVDVAATAGLKSENEDIKTHRFDINEFIRMGVDQELADAKTLIGALWLKSRLSM